MAPNKRSAAALHPSGCPRCGGRIRWLQNYETLEIYRGCSNWVTCDFRAKENGLQDRNLETASPTGKPLG